MTTDKARTEAEARYYVECYEDHFDPHLEPEQQFELFSLFLKALTARDAEAAAKLARVEAALAKWQHEAEGLREAVRVLAKYAVSADGRAGPFKAWDSRRLIDARENALANPIAKAALDAAGNTNKETA